MGSDELQQCEDLLHRLGGEKRIDYRLERFRAALADGGHPERAVHSIVVGGTNGKGTTALYLSSALVHAGFRTGTYLSPHLQNLNERLLGNLRAIPPAALRDLLQSLQPTAERHSLTYFELMTLAMFHWARSERFDFVVLEAGLGGRLDATNVTDPVAVALTNIGFDHMEYLGDTLEKILDEKLGLLRDESLLFTSITDPALLDRIERRCLDLDAVYYFARELRREVGAVTWSGQEISIQGVPFTLACPTPGAAENAALAYFLMTIIFPKVPVPALQRGFAAVRNPARFEIVAESPRVILSGDHNPAGLVDLTAAFTRLGEKPTRIVAGFSPDKPYAEMYRRLTELSSDITLTTISRHRGAMPADYRTLGRHIESAEAALDDVLARSSPDDTVLVTGSLYLAGELRHRWRPGVEFRRDPGTFPDPLAGTAGDTVPVRL